jgi:hypothetical protein
LSICFGLKNADPKVSLSLSFAVTTLEVEEVLISRLILRIWGDGSRVEEMLTSFFMVEILGEAFGDEDGT